MKYLKKYNESSNHMVDDLKDILLEISDLGFYTYVSNEDYITTVTISRLRNVKGFIRSEMELNVLKDILIRIKEYGKLNNNLVDLTWMGRINNLTLEEFNKIMNDNRFTMYITMYPKHR